MNVYYVGYVETYSGSHDGSQERGSVGPWRNKEDAEKAMEFMRGIKRGSLYDFAPLYETLRVTQDEVFEDFSESQVY